MKYLKKLATEHPWVAATTIICGIAGSAFASWMVIHEPSLKVELKEELSIEPIVIPFFILSFGGIIALAGYIASSFFSPRR